MWSGEPGMARFLPEAKTTRDEPRGMVTAGSDQRSGAGRLLVRCQPERLTGLAVGL